MSKRELQRKEVKRIIKEDLNVKAPRTGKRFKENIIKMDVVYRDMPKSYKRDYLGEMIREYYFKYNSRHKDRIPLDITALRGGALDSYATFYNKENINNLGGGALGKNIQNMIKALGYAKFMKTVGDIVSGEKHAPLITEEGVKIAQFMGPGTKLNKRLKRGDEPLTPADRVALIHDIQYGLAKNPDDIRKADELMIKHLNKLSENNQDYAINIMLGKYGIKAKMFLEDFFFKKGKLFSDFTPTSKITKYRLQNKLEELRKQGFVDDGDVKSLKAPDKKIEEDVMNKVKMKLEKEEKEEKEDKKEKFESLVKPEKKKKEPEKKKKEKEEDLIKKELEKEAKKAGKELSDDELKELIKKILNIGDFKGRKGLKVGKRY